MNLSDEIKSKLDIVDVIRDYIQLKPAGMNFRAVCPFHQEKSPSFMVSPEKQIWHCFGCAKGGDVFSFVMEIEGVNFVESLRILAPKAGVQFKMGDPALSSQRNRLLDILELSARYYHKFLTDSKQAEKAREYLTKRGLTDETIADWRIGYSQDSWDDLVNFLKGRGFKDNEIFLAGMSVKKEGGSQFYNRFRGRIMFPIYDVSGNVIAFTARVSPEKEATETMGKYINSPQTMIYDKSKVLFGLDKAKMKIKKEDLAILVEGQMDVTTAHQHGFDNVVASSGTALTTEQVILIKRYTNNIALAFDMDKAGEAALDRGMQEAMAAEMNIKIVRLPSGKDPDESIKNNPKEWVEAVETAKPMMQYIFDRTFAVIDIKNIDGRQKAVKILLPVIAKLGSKIDQDYWLKVLCQAIDAQEDILREALHKFLNKKSNQVVDKRKVLSPASEKRLGREESLSETLLALTLRFPELIGYVNNKIQAEHIVGVDNQALYKKLTIYYNIITEKNEAFSDSAKDFFVNFTAWLKEENEYSQNKESNVASQPDFLGRLAIFADKDFFEYDIDKSRLEIIGIVNVLKKNYLSGQMKEVQKLIAEAEKKNDEANMNGLMEELKMLIEEIRQIENN